MSGLPLATEPVVAYVLGVPRSGTTLLTHLLAQHPTILCPEEPWLMLALESFGAVPATHPGDPKLVYLAIENLFVNFRTELLGKVAQTIYRDLLSRNGRQIMIDKTPRYYHCLSFINQAIPRAKFVWIRRNPLDVAASYKATWNIDIAALIGGCHDTPHFFDFALGFRQLADFSDTNAVCIVLYEDLVKNTQTEMDRIFRHLDIPSHNVTDLNPDHSGGQAARFGDQKIFQTRSVHSNSVGRHLSILSPGELEAVMGGLGRELFDRMGYGGDYDRTARKLSAPVVDRSEVTHREALLLLKRRATWSRDYPLAWYVHTQQIASLTNVLGKTESDLRKTESDLRKAESDIRSMESDLAKIEDDRAALRRSLQAAEAERNRVIAERDAILASRTWRMMAPLRRLRGKLSASR